MVILGITGNLGSGKSTVSKHLVTLGATVSHSDDLAKELLQNDMAILQKLAHRFGADILDDTGVLQRSLLAERAFATEQDQQFLNQLIHPEVRKHTLARMHDAELQNIPMFVVDAPLLFEAGVDEICHSVLVIAADSNLRMERVLERSQISNIDFKRRDDIQLSIEEKIRRADHVIFNNGSLKDLLKQVEQFYGKIIS